MGSSPIVISMIPPQIKFDPCPCGGFKDRSCEVYAYDKKYLMCPRCLWEFERFFSVTTYSSLEEWSEIISKKWGKFYVPDSYSGSTAHS